MSRELLLFKVHERRKKRQIIPLIYFTMEIVFIWLVLTLINLRFNPLGWNIWSIFIALVFIGYSLFKTINVYERQKNI